MAILVLSCVEWGTCHTAEEGRFAVITLDTGGQLSGIVMEMTEDTVLLDMGFGETLIDKGTIVEIEHPEGGELERRKGEWRKSTSTSVDEDSEARRKAAAEAARRRGSEYLRIQEEAVRESSRMDEYTIRFTDPSRIMANATIDGRQTFPLLVDTGATTVAIPLQVARRLGYNVSRSARTVPVVLADGTRRQAVPITLRSLEVAGLKAENVEAMVMLAELDYGLLGMTYLNRFQMSIDNEKRKMILRRK